MDAFYLKSKKETEKMIKEYWEDCEYLVKVRIILKAYPGYSITKLEARNINKLFQALSLEKRKEIYSEQYKYQIGGI